MSFKQDLEGINSMQDDLARCSGVNLFLKYIAVFSVLSSALTVSLFYFIKSVVDL